MVLDDPGGGVVEVLRFEYGTDASLTINATGAAGPGSFLFIRKKDRTTFAAGQTGSGSTTSSIDWGVITGWSIAGGVFCNSSSLLCTSLVGIQEDMTIPAVLPSSTYDIGTWTFDATGYISGTFNLNTSNIMIFLNGKLFGASLPALPIAGLGALAVGLLVVGARSLMRDGRTRR